MPETQLREFALRKLIDRPRWIEARALLLSNHCRVFGTEAGFAIRNEAPGGQLAVVVGNPTAETLDAAIRDREPCEILCALEDEAAVAAHFPNWSREEALLFGLRKPELLASPDPCVLLLKREHSLRHLPDELRQEIDGAREVRDVWCAFKDGVASSFAYSYWRTEGQCDISIDTVSEFRRLGLAQLAVSELIRRERAHGLEPVWGAMATNVASQQLAGTLGFEQTDTIVLFSSP